MNYKEIRKKAKEFCENHSINTAPVEIIKICNDLGIEVFETYLNDGVSGLIIVDNKPWEQYENAQQFIIVNLMENPARRRFTIAHELAHYVLHRNGNVLYAHRDIVEEGNKPNKIESEANYFAANILMPEDMVRQVVESIQGKYWGKIPNFVLTKELSDIFLVSESAANVRLRQLDLC